MGIDIRDTRRTNRNRCLWYKADHTKQEVLERTYEPQGVFYARQVADINIGHYDLQNVMKRTKKTLSITTNDDVSGLEVDDWIIYKDELYIVETVSFKEQRRSEALSKRPVSDFVIGIRK